jgi:hypothetical protein
MTATIDLSEYNCGTFYIWGGISRDGYIIERQPRHTHLWKIDGEHVVTACGKSFTPSGDDPTACGTGFPSCPKCSKAMGE